jgi:2-polyprenyl-3-methyl-5-hydroxy-6-metoxy-1,4-benzoquinol methylase
MTDLSVIASWQKNATPWTAAIRDQQIESRRLVTDRAVVDAVLARTPRRVLDIGCGEGWLCRALAAHGIETTGVDVVPALIESARATAGAGDYRVASYEEIAAGSLALTVDLAVANFSLIGHEAVDALLRRIPSLLVPHGHLVVQTLHPAAARGELPYVDGWRPGSWAGFGPEFTDPAPWYFRTIGRWVELLRESGFVLRELREPVHPVTGNPASLLLVAEVA